MEGRETDEFVNGLCAFGSRNFSTAAELFSRAVAEHPENPNYRYYIAMSLRELGEREKAVEHLSFVLQNTAAIPAFLYLRGELLLEMEEIDLAEADFSAVISREYGDRYWRSLAYLNRGLIFLERDLIEEAILDLSSAEDLARAEGNSWLLARISSELETAGF